MSSASTEQENWLQAAYDECRSITRREAKNFYYAFLTLPPQRRRAIYVVYAFCRHCDDSVDTGGSIEEKLATLSQIRQDLAGSPLTGAATPLFMALADVADTYDIPQQHFQDLVSGVETDLVKTRYADFQELRQYCYQVASVVGLICLQIFGFQDSRARQHAVDLGLAMQLTNIARDVKEDLDMGRIYLPQDEIARFGYSEEDLKAGMVNQQFIELMRFQATRAKEYFQSGFQLLPYLSHRSRACPAVLGGLYCKVLDRIESHGYDVFSYRASLTGGEKLRLLAQAWLGSYLRGVLPTPNVR